LSRRFYRPSRAASNVPRGGKHAARRQTGQDSAISIPRFTAGRAISASYHRATFG
jgi:hypothetical protein